MKRKQYIRAKFRDAVFDRDDYICQKCGFKGDDESLDAHHITDRNEMPNGGYVKENGITLCKKCHKDAEEFHSSNGRRCKKGFHPSDFYAIIRSSKDKAVQVSEKLN